jgi:hypothetical protein
MFNGHFRFSLNSAGWRKWPHLGDKPTIWKSYLSLWTVVSYLLSCLVFLPPSFSFPLAVLRFECRVSCLLGKHSISWTSSPSPFSFCFCLFLDRVSCFCSADLRPWSSYHCLPSSWNYRYIPHAQLSFVLITGKERGEAFTFYMGYSMLLTGRSRC